MLKKILLFVMIIVVFQLSSTSSLKVIEPHTWFNHAVYNENASVFEVLSLESRFYDGYFPGENGLLYANTNFFAHKLAHITAYSILSLLFLSNIKRRKHAFKQAWFSTFVIAFLDECNQYIIVGRTGLFLDVIVDATSAFVTLLFVYIFWVKSLKNKVIKNEGLYAMR